MIYDTPEKLAKRREQMEDRDIHRLFALHDKRYKVGDSVGANRIAWILSTKYGIEGDRSFRMGSSDCE